MLERTLQMHDDILQTFKRNKIRTLVEQDKVRQKARWVGSDDKSLQKTPHSGGKTCSDRVVYEITIAVAKLDLHQNYEPSDSSISGYIRGSKQCRVG